MGDIDAPSAFEVSDGTGHIQYAVEGPGREVKPLGGRLQKALGAIVQLQYFQTSAGLISGLQKKLHSLNRAP